MTMTATYKRKGIKGIVFAAMLAFAALTSFGAEAASSCTVKYSGGNVTPECPDGRKARYDISPKCIEDANKAAGNCLNTMPVTNVARIPEDVCHRGEGWSRKRNHNGMDYAAGMGTAVTAAMDGTITRYSFGVSEPARGVCQSSGGGYGNVVYIEHKGCDGTYTTRYGHLTNKPVPGLREGSKVKKGDLIGYVGGTGGACGRPHLHFELRGPGDALVNPMCDQVQGICNCKTPVPSSGLSKCKDATFAASSSTPIDPAAGVTAVSVGTANNAETPAKSSASCAPYEEVRNSYREWGCIFCKPFEILFNTASVMAKKSFDNLAKAVIAVVVVAFAIWLSFVTIRFVSTMEIREPRIFVKTLLNQAFRVLVVVILLNSGLSQILALSVDPVFSTGLKVAQLAGKISDTCDLGSHNITIVGTDKGGLSPSMGTGILCTIKAIQDQIGDILALGELSWCLSWSSEYRVMLVFPHLGYLLTAILFYLGGFMLLFIYPFMLVDCILKLSIAVALLPAALGAFAFKITANYLQEIWKIFLNAIFSFIFLSLIIYIIASIAADSLSEMIGGSDVGIIMKFFWWMAEVIKVVAVCFLGYAVLEEMKHFADSFAGSLKIGGNEGIGSPTSSFGMEFFAKRPGMAVGKPIAKGAKALGTATGRAISEGVHRASINGWKQAAEGKTVINPFNPFSRINSGIEKTRDENGNEVYDTTSAWQKLRGKKEYRTFTTDASGNTKMNVTVQDKKGRRTEVETDAYATVTRKYDRDGVKMREDTKVNAALLKYAMKKDGTYNPEVVSNFMQNSLLSEENKQIMFVQAVMKERMSEAAEQMGDSFESRTVEKGQDEEGRETWTVNQTNRDGSRSTFKVTFGANNRVLSEFKNVDASGKGKAFATDGIVQRKSYISVKTNADGSKETIVENRYAFSSYYSKIANRPLYSNGDMADNIPAGEIMFGEKDMSSFAHQVGKKGNKAYTFREFN